MKVLLTGASGFLGSHVAEALVARGHAVRALLRATSRAEHLPDAVERVQGDLDDQPALEQGVDGVDAVVHVAGLVKARSEEDFRRVNVQGTAHLIDAALPHAARLRRFVLVSSVAAGGPTDTPASREPGTADEPVTRYGRSKLEGERVALATADRLAVSVIRPPVLYGPRDRESLPLYRAARLGLRLVMRGGVTHTSMLHARDCAGAITDLLERDHPRGRVYPVDDGVVHAVADTSAAIAAAVRPRTFAVPIPVAALRPFAAVGELWGRLTGSMFIVDRDKLAEFAGPCWVVGHDAITRDVGWQPAIVLADGLAETVRWYRDAGWL